MVSKKSFGKTLAVTMIAVSLVFAGEAGKAWAKMPRMDGNELVQQTERLLKKQTVVRKLSEQATAQAGKCGDFVKGGYQVEPEKIVPWTIDDGKAVSVVSVRTRGSKETKLFNFAFLFKEDGYRIVYLYPGTSNTDPVLFADVSPAAEGLAQARLNSKEATLKDTKIIGAIGESGWDEEWLWANGNGESCRMRITFTTSPGGGTNWSIKEL